MRKRSEKKITRTRANKTKIIKPNQSDFIEQEMNPAKSENKNTDHSKIQNLPANDLNPNLDELIHKALSKWKKEFDNDIVRTDSISDLEKLIKLNILIKDENIKHQNIIDNVLDKTIEIINNTVEESDLKIKIFERLKDLKYEEFI
jgi:hypothetical protein